MVVVGTTLNITAFHRATVFIEAVLTGDTSQMISADHSASIRVVPWILCIDRISLFSFRSWVGEGIGSVSQWMSIYMPGVEAGWSGGGTASMLVEYGLIIGLYYLITSFKFCFSKKYKLTSIGLWGLCILPAGINIQMAWLCILLLYIVKHIQEIKVADQSN